MSYCFEDLELDAVFCGYFKRNSQSKRVNEKVGFKYVRDTILETRYNTLEDSVLTVIHKKIGSDKLEAAESR